MGRREENKRQKRERLEAVGLAAFLEHGYDRTSIEQVAAGAEVARGTFYLYFQDKHSLFEALVDRWFEPLMDVYAEVHEKLSEATTRPEVMAIYQEMALDLALLGIRHSEVVLMVFRENRHASEAGEGLRRREVRMQEAVTEITRLAAERGLITAENPRLVGMIIAGAVEKLYYEYLIGSDLGAPEALAHEVVNLVGRLLELPVDELNPF